MKKIDGLNIKELKWTEARDDIYKINKELVEVVDRIKISSEYKIYEAHYNYGELILNEGQLMLPDQDGLAIPFNSPKIPTALKDDLSYSSAPIGLIMSNTVEVFIESKLDVIPLTIFSTGRMLGLLETVDPVGMYCLRHIWNASAGARSVYMLPKITDRLSHSKLQREFGLTISAPKNYFDHFSVFKRIISTAIPKEKKWFVKILFFSKKWLGSKVFMMYLKNYMVQHSSYARNKSTFDVLWHFFSKELTEMNRKPNCFVLDTLKHIVKILIGASPGYAPVCNDDTRGPLDVVQKIYLDFYKLSSIPTILVPYHFQAGDSKSGSVIHSMNNSWMFESIPRMREFESLIVDLVQAESLFRIFYELGKNGKLNVRKTILEKVFDETELLYFHTNPGNHYYGIKLASTIPTEDKKFLFHPYQKEHESLKFSEHAEFIKSCILIKNKKNRS